MIFVPLLIAVACVPFIVVGLLAIAGKVGPANEHDYYRRLGILLTVGGLAVLVTAVLWQFGIVFLWLFLVFPLTPLLYRKKH